MCCKRKVFLLSVLLLCLSVLICGCSRHSGEGSSEETAASSEGSSGSGEGSESSGGEESSEAPDTGRVKELLESMTLRRKIAQMLMPDIVDQRDEYGSVLPTTVLGDALKSMIETYGFGGVILFAGNLTGTAQSAELISDLQAASPIPMLISVDQEGGYVTRLGTGTSFCGNMALAATGNPAEAKRASTVIGQELSALGINVDFAPVMDVNSNPENPVIGIRSFSDDPQAVTAFGTAFIDGLHAGGVAAALKHFPGHGDTDTDSHSGLPLVNKTLAELLDSELLPFAAGMREGADIIMTAHIQYPLIEKETYASRSTGEPVYLPATLSETFVRELLRGYFKYDGVVCTDSLEMDAIYEHFDRLDAARLAINAGVDILLIPLDLSSENAFEEVGAYIDGIASMVEQGVIAPETVDAAVTRILTLKLNRGILDLVPDREEQVKKALSVVGSKANHEIEWAITQKAVTLVKNDGNFLPVRVSGGEKVLLFCAYEDEVRSMEYAISRLKQEGFFPKSAECSVYCYSGCTASEFEVAVQRSSVVIASTETYSVADIQAEGASGWQAKFLDELIGLVHANGKKIAVVSIALPYDLARYQEADALLAAYSSAGMKETPKTFAGETKTYGPNLPAAVYGAFGGFSFSGKLPVNIPVWTGVGYSGKILYPRGFGLEN